MMNNMLQKITDFIKKETVLTIATALAVASAFWVHPGPQYVGYIDWRVLGILLSLMLIVAGFQSNGLFDAIGSRLLAKTKNTAQLMLVLVFFVLFFQYVYHKRRRTSDVCAVCVHDSAEMPPGAADCDSVCAADACSKSGEHADADRESAESIPLQHFRRRAGRICRMDGAVYARVGRASAACRVRAQRGQAPDLAGNGGAFADVRDSRQEEKRDLSGALCAKPAFGGAGISVAADARGGARCACFNGSHGVFAGGLLSAVYVYQFLHLHRQYGEYRGGTVCPAKSCGGQGTGGRHRCEPDHQQCSRDPASGRFYARSEESYDRRESGRTGNAHRFDGEPDLL